MKCGYRMYPSWFKDGDIHGPINELSRHAAHRMGRTVSKVDVTGDGTDQRGYFIDFTVTYSSTASPTYEEIRR